MFIRTLESRFPLLLHPWQWQCSQETGRITSFSADAHYTFLTSGIYDSFLFCIRLKTYLAADADGDTVHPDDIEEDALKLVLGLRAKRSSIERTVCCTQMRIQKVDVSECVFFRSGKKRPKLSMLSGSCLKQRPNGATKDPSTRMPYKTCGNMW